MSKKYCPKCGKELPIEADFCPYCMIMINSQEIIPSKKRINTKKLIIICVAAVLAVVMITTGIVLVISALNGSQSTETTENLFDFTYIEFSEKLSEVVTQAEGVTVKFNPDDWEENEFLDSKLYKGNGYLINIFETIGSQNEKVDNISSIFVSKLSNESAVRIGTYCGVIASGDEYTAENIQNWYSSINYIKSNSDNITIMKYKNVTVSYDEDMDELQLQPMSEHDKESLTEFNPTKAETSTEKVTNNLYAATEPPTKVPTTLSKDDEYILPDSDKMKLSNKDIDDLSEEELELARNEIYARHGRKFDTDYIQEYFNSQSWYNGTINPKDFSEDMLSKIEKFNVQLIADYEERLKNSVRVSFGDYSIVVPEEYIYEEIGNTVTFYEKYNHEHSDTGSTGLLFSIVKTTGVDDFISAELLGSNDKYNFYIEYPTGLGIIEDEVANQKYIDAMNMMDSVLDTFEIK